MPQGISYSTWVGVDGSRWDFTDPTARVVLMSDGVEGLHEPPFEHVSYALTRTGGAAWRQHIVKPREVFWPVTIVEPDPVKMTDLLDRWHRSFAPDKEGMWTVDVPDGSTRSLRLRLASAPHVYALDPWAVGHVKMGVKLIAMQPYWEAAPVRRSWTPGTREQWLPNTARGTFRIGSATSFGATWIDNPGDVPASPVWTVTGPTTDIWIEVGGRSVTASLVLTSTQSVTIKTGSDGSAIRNDGVDVTSSFTSWRTLSVPPKTRVAGFINVVGGGGAEMSFATMHRRAF